MQDDASSVSSTGQPLRDTQQPIVSLSGRCSGPAGSQQTATDVVDVVCCLSHIY